MLNTELSEFEIEELEMIQPTMHTGETGNVPPQGIPLPQSGNSEALSVLLQVSEKWGQGSWLMPITNQIMSGMIFESMDAFNCQSLLYRHAGAAAIYSLISVGQFDHIQLLLDSRIPELMMRVIKNGEDPFLQNVAAVSLARLMIRFPELRMKIIKLGFVDALNYLINKMGKYFSHMGNIVWSLYKATELAPENNEPSDQVLKTCSGVLSSSHFFSKNYSALYYAIRCISLIGRKEFEEAIDSKIIPQLQKYLQNDQETCDIFEFFLKHYGLTGSGNNYFPHADILFQKVASCAHDYLSGLTVDQRKGELTNASSKCFNIFHAVGKILVHKGRRNYVFRIGFYKHVLDAARFGMDISDLAKKNDTVEITLGILEKIAELGSIDEVYFLCANGLFDILGFQKSFPKTCQLSSICTFVCVKLKEAGAYDLLSEIFELRKNVQHQ